VKSSVSWLVTLTAAAEADYDEILAWTAESFGEAQAIIYSQVLDVAILALAAGPHTTGVKTRDNISPGLFSLHVARHGARGRHLLLFRVKKDRPTEIEVLRILHDSMDLVVKIIRMSPRKMAEIRPA
jgi:toxin ParE1/3/4